MRGQDSVSVHTDYYNIRLESGEVVPMSREEMSDLVRKTMRRARGSDHPATTAMPPPPPPPGLPPTSPVKRRRSPRKAADDTTSGTMDERNPIEDDRQSTFDSHGDYHDSSRVPPHEPQSSRASTESYTVITEREGPKQLSQGEIRWLVRSSILQARQQQSRSTGGSRRGTTPTAQCGASPMELGNSGSGATKGRLADKGPHDKNSDTVSVATEPSQLTEPSSLRRISDELREGTGGSTARRHNDSGRYLDSETDAHEDVLKNARRLLSTMDEEFSDPIETLRSAQLSPIADDETITTDVYARNEPQFFTFHETDLAENSSPRTKSYRSPTKKHATNANETPKNEAKHLKNGMSDFENEFYEFAKETRMNSDLFKADCISVESKRSADNHPCKPDPEACHIDAPTPPRGRSTPRKNQYLDQFMGSDPDAFMATPPKNLTDMRPRFTSRGKERISQYNKRTHTKKTLSRRQRSPFHTKDAVFSGGSNKERPPYSFKSPSIQEDHEVSVNQPFSGHDIETIVHISMEKAQKSALHEVQEMLQDFKRHKDKIGLKTMDGYKLVTQNEIAELVKESMHKARQVAQQEIADVIRESMNQARESAQAEIRELVIHSMQRARESALKEMSSVVKETLREARADDATAVSASAFTLTVNSVPTIHRHPHDGVPSFSSAKTSQTETFLLGDQLADNIPEASSGSVFERVGSDDSKQSCDEKTGKKVERMDIGIESSLREKNEMNINGKFSADSSESGLGVERGNCGDESSSGSLHQQASCSKASQRNDSAGAYLCGVFSNVPNEQSDGENASFESQHSQQKRRLSSDMEEILANDGHQEKGLERSTPIHAIEASAATEGEKKSKRKYKCRDNLAPLSPSGWSHVSISASDHPETNTEDPGSKSSKHSRRSSRRTNSANEKETVTVTDELLTQMANLKGSTVTQAELNILFALAQDDSASSALRVTSRDMGAATKSADDKLEVPEPESKFCVNFMDLLSMDDRFTAYKDGSLSMTSSYGPNGEREWLSASSVPSNLNDTFSGTDQDSNEQSALSETSDEESQSRRS